MVEFPKDSLKHDCIIEWWYFNGHLKDGKGKEYSFMDCLFRADPKKSGLQAISHLPLKTAYFSHSILSDLGKKKFVPRIHPLSILSKDSFSRKELFVDYTHPAVNYINYEIEEPKPGVFRIKTEDFELTLKSKKKPFLHNGDGGFNVRGKKVHYYSYSNMDVEGIVLLDGKEVKVRGKGWMDHEWADFTATLRWNWFSVQLDDNVELMIQDYNEGENTYVGMMHKDGRTEFFKDLILIPQKSWKSSMTLAEYPIEWKIKVPSKKIDLNVRAEIKNQEMLFGTLNYWEGPTSIKGKIHGKKVNGNGFMEITGREMHKSKIKLYEDELKEKILHYLNHKKN